MNIPSVYDYFVSAVVKFFFTDGEKNSVNGLEDCVTASDLVLVQILLLSDATFQFI